MELQPVEDSEKPNKTRSWLKVVTVLILCFINFIYYADRFGIAGILIDIQCAFDANDAEAGLIQAAFVISYCIAAPILGFLGDRFSRKWIMFTGMLIWSGAALTASFMQDYWSFFACRALLGLGEACYSSLAPAIISDLYSRTTRSKYLAMYYFTIPVGSGVGYVLFAGVSQATDNWRWGLRVTPIAGFLSAALILFFLLDPPRGESEGSQLKSTSLAADLKYLMKNRSYLYITIATTAVAFLAGAFGTWGPKYITLGLVTQEGTNLDESNTILADVSFVFGVITVISGLLGVIIGAVMGAKLRIKYPTADPLICGFGVLSAVPLFFASMMLAAGPIAPTYITFFFAEWFVNLNWALATDMLLSCLVPTRRASAKSIQIVLNHVLGDAGSPFVIGLISDAIKPLLETSPDSDEKSQLLIVNESFSKATDDCSITSINVETAQRDFIALQYALFVALFIQVIGAFAFVITSWVITDDKEVVERASRKPDVVTHNNKVSTSLEPADTSYSRPDDEKSSIPTVKVHENNAKHNNFNEND